LEQARRFEDQIRIVAARKNGITGRERKERRKITFPKSSLSY
jgi:hypothetical protein